jgi:hypothetical protein
MFRDKDVAFAVRENMLAICALLTRSYVHVVLPSQSSQQEKDNYRSRIEGITSQIELVLNDTFAIHPSLQTCVYDIEEGLKVRCNENV